ncbi:putative membrane protein [Natronospira proteinivora]|uniref:Membrane protein n=1 Tax=Natronospira proteinivora TaxID=1807133 RepID=A0ABT1G7L7_9GAMM|nr:SRPBCC family protein [Natronospira proteinivora]MCP1727216.1 putative membrane protein [Natronospira proteinivora]
MPIIEHEATLKAEPQAVFELISRVEPFVDLTEAVKAIEALGDERYRWHVRVAGFKLQFEVQVTDIQPPNHFAWRSLTGVPNRGRYTLTPTEDGTRLHFKLEYELKNRLLEKAVSGTTRSIVHRLSNEIVGNVERTLAR